MMRKSNYIKVKCDVFVVKKRKKQIKYVNDQIISTDY